MNEEGEDHCTDQLVFEDHPAQDMGRQGRQTIFYWVIQGSS